MKALSWTNFILGVWLIVAAFVFSRSNTPIMTEEIVMGITIACLAAISVASTTQAISWLVAVAGLWTLLAPAFIGYGQMAASRVNDIVVGIAVFVVASANALYRQRAVRAGI